MTGYKPAYCDFPTKIYQNVLLHIKSLLIQILQFIKFNFNSINKEMFNIIVCVNFLNMSEKINFFTHLKFLLFLVWRADFLIKSTFWKGDPYFQKRARI